MSGHAAASRWRWPVIAVIAAAIAITLAAGSRGAPETRVTAPETKSAAALTPLPLQPALRAAPALSTASTTVAAVAPTPPAGVDAAQWAALQREMLGRADGAAELERLAQYFGWSYEVGRWRDQATPASERAVLAAAIEAGLEARLARREVGGAEARALKAALLAARGVDGPRQQAALTAWAESVSPADGSAPDPRQARLLKLQAERLAAWRALPTAQRDPAALQAELETLRRTVYAR